MSLEILLSSSVPVLNFEDTIDQTLLLMEENKLSHLPVVQEDNYMGLISEGELLDISNHESTLKDSCSFQFKPAVHVSRHPYEAMRILYDMNITALPVIDEDEKYLGCITKGTLLKYVAEKSFLNAPGGIIVIEIPGKSYSLCEIARICENEDVLIVDLQAFANAEGQLEVTLKTNKMILDAVVSSFERYNYSVKEVYSEEMNKDDIINKYNLLMNYINM